MKRTRAGTYTKFDPETGQPLGKRRANPWIQIAAVSQDQTNNTFRMFPSLISEELKEEFKLEVHKTVIHTPEGGVIEAATSSPNALEGKRPTLVIMNEIQWWLENNGGHDMSRVIKGNVTKLVSQGSRYLAICNAHRPGEESIGESMWQNYERVTAGDAVDTKLLYDALEAPADTPIDTIPSFDKDPEGFQMGVKRLKAALEVVRGDSWWLDIDGTVESILDTSNVISESRRMYLNQVNAAEDAWIPLVHWNNDAIRDTTLKLNKGDKITMGFDGSKSQDWSALVACRVDDGALFLLGSWNPKAYGGEVPREAIDTMVHWAFRQFDVVGFRADVREFEAYIDSWSKTYGSKLKIKASPKSAVGFDMRSNQKTFALDAERFKTAVLELALKHDGNPILTQHVGNAHEFMTNYDARSIRKATKDSDRKIDAAVCAVLAYASRIEYQISVKPAGNLNIWR